MGIKGDSALSSFTTSELTESSAIHGDFDQASLNYSGHQNLEVRAEDGMEGVGYPVEWEDVRRDMKYPKEDNNNGLIYGVEWMDGEEIVDISWFKTEAERDAELKKSKEWHIKEYGAETLGKDSCCCGATKSKPCACMKAGTECSNTCACSTKAAEYDRPTPKWAKPLGLIGGLAAGYISAQMIDNTKE